MNIIYDILLDWGILNCYPLYEINYGYTSKSNLLNLKYQEIYRCDLIHIERWNIDPEDYEEYRIP